MARYEALRDRLPLLYRPDVDDTAATALPLGRNDLAELRGDTAAIRFTATPRDGALVVVLGGSGPVRTLRLASGRAPGRGYALALRAIEDGGALSLAPIAVLPVVDGVAAVGATALPGSFAVELRQRSLLALQLVAVAGVLERLNREASDVMQAHWFAYADRAVQNPFFLRSRMLQQLGVPPLTDPSVRRFPYIDDLGRLASLVSLPPWQEPIVQGGGDATPETVETYRQRIGRIVALYTNGLGTREAMRRMTEAQLPVAVDADPAQRDRPFGVEEYAPLATVNFPVQLPGQPTDRVGQLVHWPLVNDGLGAASPTVFIQAPTAAELEETTPDGELRFAACDAPLLELYRGGSLRVGLAYRDSVPAGKTLRIRPAYGSWVGLETGVAGAAASPGDVEPDPTAPGPWGPSEGSPGGPISALLRTADNALWAAVASGEVWRRDGSGWMKVLSAISPLHCLAEDGPDLLIGTDVGLLRMNRFPDGAFTPVAEPKPDGRVVRALLRAADGTLWAGTSKGLGQLQPGDVFAPTTFGVEVRALAEDSTGALYAGGPAGLAAYRRDVGHWWWYAGDSASDDVSEWRAFDPADAAGFPTELQIFLPPVTAVLRARDGALWIGTEHGLARYVARGDGGPVAFRTLLEAFPDLCPGRVDAIVEDERGLIWACTDRGLLRYDGRDWFEFRSGGVGWSQLGRADSLYPGGDPVERGAWRFRRAASAWERFDTKLVVPDWTAFAGAVRTAVEQPVHALAFTDALAADLVDSWSPADFAVSGSTPVDPARFVTRVKLDGDKRVVDGGIPALPRLPAGRSHWRYLSLEDAKAPLPADRPAWTTEGRLLPAETAAPDPEPGRYDIGAPEPEDEPAEFDEAVFAYPPSARVGVAWEPKRPLSVLVRLSRRGPDETIDPAVLDRVFAGMQSVRSAGVRAALAVGEKPVRKES